MARRSAPPPTLRARVDAILSDERVAWLPVRHHSPGCAWHVERWILEHRPVAVLVEGPDDANALLPYLLHPETTPPVAVLSTWVDTRGVVRPPDDSGAPARFRSFYPIVGHGPEWAALRSGHAVGASVRFVDLPHDALVKATAGLVSDAGPRHLAESAWFARLAARTGRPSFDAFFDATFEARAHRLSTQAFFRELLLFALCTREATPDPGGLEADGTLVREAHMAWHVAQARTAFPEGRVCVVTGAFHTAALPTTKPRRGKVRADRATRVVMTATSHATLARLAGVSSPAWAAAVHDGLRAGLEAPAQAAAERLLVEVGARLRAAGWAVGTADAVAAVTLATGLGALRGGGPAAADVRETARHAFVRGDRTQMGLPIDLVVDAVFTGHARGTLPADAGRPPLVEDFHAEAKRHRLDLSGEAARIVRCDVLRQEAHRAKSAFLHRASFLRIPMFEALPDGQGPPWFKGPDPLREEGAHLLGETWGVRGSEGVDDELLALSDRGVTLVEVAVSALSRARAAAGTDLVARTGVVVDAARMRLLELLPVVLKELGDAMPVSARFDERVFALRELSALATFHEALPTFGRPEVVALAARAFTAACLALPSVGAVAPDAVEATLGDVSTLLRTDTAGGVPTDRELLVDQLRLLLRDASAPVMRGAAAGALCALGAASERSVAAALSAAFRGADARSGAAFLEGVLRSSRSVLVHGRALFREVHAVLGGLDERVFLAVLPDLRRAFSVFVPAELEAVGARVAEACAPPSDLAVAVLDDAAVRRAREVDARVASALSRLYPD